MGRTVVDIFKKLASNQRVFIQGGAATPNRLIDLLLLEADRLSNVEIIHLHTMGPAKYTDPKFKTNFRIVNLFVGENIRAAVDLDHVDYLPCFLSEVPNLFRSGQRTLDMALIHVSPPDQNGFCSLGTSVDVARAAVASAAIVVAQINKRMPRVHGEGFIHVNDLDAWIEIDEPLPQSEKAQLKPEELAIGHHVASLIEDGSTLQVGIGSIPDAVLSFLKDRKNLGVHTEMWSDGILDLIQAGAIDNSRKKVHPGRTVSGFIIGTQAVYDFIHDNPSVVQLDIGYINNPSTIARNPQVVAINSAVEIDLTGQVCADSIGPRIISGVGGQMDFIRGASLSPGGKPILAMTCRTRKKIPRIVPFLKSAAGVVTTRSHVHYIVTEYGVANLYGKTLGERAKALIALAHPDDREHLARDWHTLRKLL